MTSSTDPTALREAADQLAAVAAAYRRDDGRQDASGHRVEGAAAALRGLADSIEAVPR